jgi:hypothetical protein
MRSAVSRSAPRSRLRSPEEVQKTLLYTASFAAFTGRARTIFRAGLALNTVGSFVNGLMPFRSLVARVGRKLCVHHRVHHR